MNYKFKLFDGKSNLEGSVDLSMYKNPAGFLAAVDAAHPMPLSVPKASEQLLAQCGFYRNNDVRSGIQSASIRTIFDGMQAAGTSPGNTGIERLVAPAAILSAVQNDLYEDKSGVLGRFKQLVGVMQTVNGLRYERPVFNYDASREGRSMPVAQLAEPTIQGTLTASSSSGTIPVFSSTLAVSDQVVDYFGFSEIQKCMSIWQQKTLLIKRIVGW